MSKRWWPPEGKLVVTLEKSDDKIKVFIGGETLGVTYEITKEGVFMEGKLIASSSIPKVYNYAKHVVVDEVASAFSCFLNDIENALGVTRKPEK